MSKRTFPQRTCEACGVEFTPTGGTQRYCRVQCSPTWKRQHPLRQCRVCGASWVNIGSGPRVLCSPGCKREDLRKEKVARRGVCELCGAAFITTQPSRRWCSRRCGRRAGKGVVGGRYRVMDTFDCLWCGRTFERLAVQRNRKFCDSAHQKAYASWRYRKSPFASAVPTTPIERESIPCAWCRESFVPGRSVQRFCKDECRLSNERIKSCRVWFRECGECGDMFAGRLETHKFCSKPCRKARQKWPISPKKRQKVCERDGGVCQICGELTDESDFEMVMGSDGRETFVAGGRYPSVDHIVPKSVGGGHEMSNLRTTHRDCNSLRGVGDGEQLAWAV